jgi:hypothetical protein
MADPKVKRIRPHRDPLLRVLKGQQPRSADQIVKGTSPMADTGSPDAGRTTLEEAKRKGLPGYLQVLGPGLITGASDDDQAGSGPIPRSAASSATASSGRRSSPSP